MNSIKSCKPKGKGIEATRHQGNEENHFFTSACTTIIACCVTHLYFHVAIQLFPTYFGGRRLARAQPGKGVVNSFCLLPSALSGVFTGDLAGFTDLSLLSVGRRLPREAPENSFV